MAGQYQVECSERAQRVERQRAGSGLEGFGWQANQVLMAGTRWQPSASASGVDSYRANREPESSQLRYFDSKGISTSA